MKNFTHFFFILFLVYNIETKILIIPEPSQSRKLMIAYPQKNYPQKKSTYFQKNFSYSRGLNNSENLTPQNPNIATLKNEENIQNKQNIKNMENIQNKEKEYNPKNYQTYTIETRENNINNVLNSAMNSTENKPLIIINHQETHHIPMEKNDQTEENRHQQNSKLIQKENSVNNLDLVSIDDLPTLEMILENVKKIYTNFYDKLPEENGRNDIDKIDGEDLNKYFIKLKTFTRDVIMNSQNLMNDINYFQRKVHLIKSGENEMISFYNFEERYARFKTQSALMEDKQIKVNWSKIYAFSKDFNTEEPAPCVYNHSINFQHESDQHLQGKNTNKLHIINTHGP